MDGKINWLIFDDDEFVIYTYMRQLSSFDDLHCVGGVGNIKDCLSIIEKNHIDILLLDIQMQTETTGIDELTEILKVSPKIKTIMLTSFDDENYIFSSFASGAIDYCFKDCDIGILHKMMADVYNNTSSLRPQIAQVLSKRAKEIETGQRSLLYMIEIMTQLSTSEFEVLKEIYKGKSYSKIAEERFVDVSTVKTHASRILKKFKCSTMKELLKHLGKLNLFNLLEKI